MRRFAGAAHFLQHQKAAALGHHHVENHEVGILALRKGKPLVAVAGDQHRVAVRLERKPQRLDDLGVVIDEQNAFACLLIRYLLP